MFDELMTMWKVLWEEHFSLKDKIVKIDDERSHTNMARRSLQWVYILCGADLLPHHPNRLHRLVRCVGGTYRLNLNLLNSFLDVFNRQTDGVS